tara:strand:- start:5629 stop:6876 length:1248 start_codon:yes stop_codon:yes gene_type:complete
MNSKLKKTLIIITNGFPLSNSEIFLEKELDYLKKYFSDITIISCNPKINELPKKTNKELNVLEWTCNYHLKKIRSLMFMFHPLFWKEIYRIRNQYQKKISITIIKAACSGLFYAVKLKKTVLELVQKTKNEVVVYSYWFDNNALAIALLNKNIKKVVRAHGWDLYNERTPINYQLFSDYIESKIDQLHFISEDGANYYMDAYKPNPKKIIISKLGVENNFNITDIENYDKGETLNIVSNSFIYPNKRIDLLIDCISKLKMNVRWIHIGGGYKQIYFQQILSLANKKLDELKNVSFEFTGNITNKEVYELYRENQIDLLINLSLSEGLPVTFMEAFSFAIPVLATDVGGVKEIINHKSGFLVNKHDSSVIIANKINDFWALNSTEIKNLKINAYDKWKNEFNSDVNYDSFAKKVTH